MKATSIFFIVFSDGSQADKAPVWQLKAHDKFAIEREWHRGLEGDSSLTQLDSPAGCEVAAV